MTTKSKNKGGVQVIDREDTSLKPPKKWSVLFHNDDYTPFEFVEMLLMKVFRKTKNEAQMIAKSIHEKGAGVAGIYTHCIAETKVIQCYNFLKETEYPLLVTKEPE